MFKLFFDCVKTTVGIETERHEMKLKQNKSTQSEGWCVREKIYENILIAWLNKSIFHACKQRTFAFTMWWTHLMWKHIFVLKSFSKSFNISLRQASDYKWAKFKSNAVLSLASSITHQIQLSIVLLLHYFLSCIRVYWSFSFSILFFISFRFAFFCTIFCLVLQSILCNAEYVNVLVRLHQLLFRTNFRSFCSKRDREMNKNGPRANTFQCLHWSI